MLFTICFSTAAVFLEVIMRYFFQSPLVGIEELAAYVAFWLYFIGGAYGSYERSHISADISQLVFKNKLHYAKSHAITSLISSFAALYALFWAFDYVKWGFEMNEQSRSTFLGSTYPVVFFQASIFIGLALMSFYFFIESCQWFKAAFVDRQVPEKLLVAREEIDSWIG
jgi:TRAP-type C4-dicarboxylate transport system permease small subunit